MNCAGCKWVVGRNVATLHSSGALPIVWRVECRRYPPNGDGWPSVSADDYCGEWEPSNREEFFRAELAKAPTIVS